MGSRVCVCRRAEKDDTELCIVMEFCGCGDLAQKIERYKKRRQYIDERVIWVYLIQMLEGLKALHEKNIMHRGAPICWEWWERGFRSAVRSDV